MFLTTFKRTTRIIYEPRHEKTGFFAYAKTKTQTSFAVTAKLISAFGFDIRIVQSLYYLNPKLQVSSHLLWLYSSVCVGPGRKPQRPVFSQRGSYVLSHKRRGEYCSKHLSRVIRKQTFWFPTWSDTNQAVQLQKMARGLKFRI